MSKGRYAKRGRVSRVLSPDEIYLEGVLKRLHRRVAAGQQVPFLIATIEPRQVPGMAEPIADSVVASRGLGDPRLKQLRAKLLTHLVEAGVLTQKDAEPEEPKEELDTGLEG